MSTDATLAPLGDTAVTLTFGEGISEALSTRVVRAAAAIRDAGIAGVTDVVPSYAALVVHYRPLTIGFHDLRDRLRSISIPEDPSSEEPTREHVIPVRYDGVDLEDVARKLDLTTGEVVSIHSSASYRVFVIGFVPGFAYLGMLDKRLVLPRRESPRKRVPPGSVAIAEAQTGVYPSETPGGWHLIGSTSARMFDAGRNPPALLSAGDTVRFEISK
jgi:inhibitor of KinA